MKITRRNRKERQANRSNGEGRRECRFWPGLILHITSRCRLGNEYLATTEARQLLAELVEEHSRAYRLPVLHTEIDDAGFGIVVRVCQESAPVGKMVGAIKSGFTRAFKRMHERPWQYGPGPWPRLGPGTLWAGPYRATIVAEEDLEHLLRGGVSHHDGARAYTRPRSRRRVHPRTPRAPRFERVWEW